MRPRPKGVRLGIFSRLRPQCMRPSQILQGPGRIIWPRGHIGLAALTFLPVPHHSFYTGWMRFLPPNQQRQRTEGLIMPLRSFAASPPKLGELTHYIPPSVLLSGMLSSWYDRHQVLLQCQPRKSHQETKLDNWGKPSHNNWAKATVVLVQLSPKRSL